MNNKINFLKLKNKDINDFKKVILEEKNSKYQKIQKFNVEKYDNKEISLDFLENKSNENNIKFCSKCKLIINNFLINEKLIKLIFNKNKYFSISKNHKFSLINELLTKSDLCSNCFKLTLYDYYFSYNEKDSTEKIEEKILDIFQVFLNIDEEKLNFNIKLYNIFKNSINSFIEYIKDNHNNIIDENNSINIKNEEIIGIDCFLNIIDLINKNISLIKEKNLISFFIIYK